VADATRGSAPFPPRVPAPGVDEPRRWGIVGAVAELEKTPESSEIAAIPGLPPDPPVPSIWDSTAPWAMQLAVLDSRPDRPAHLAVCEAAAAAVVTLLADPRATAGEWAPLVRRWASGPIRKVVRRGRGVKWDATAAVPGVEVERAGARVRAFVPVPVDTIGRELATLQVGGTQMPELGEPSEPVPGGLTIALTPHADLSTWPVAIRDGGFTEVEPGTMTALARW
jgi:hypothetical protein